MSSPSDRVPSAIPPPIEGRDEVPSTAAAFNWQGFVVSIWAFLALGCGAVSFFLCWQQVSAVKEHHARYYISVGVSIMLGVIAFLCIFLNVDGFCFNDKRRKKVESWCREIWTLRAAMGILGIGMSVGMNFFLVEARFKLWVMLLHVSAVFFIACTIPLRIPFDLVGIWIGCTLVVAWDATKLLKHAYDLGDYATSVIVTLLIVLMTIFRAKPYPSRVEVAGARAKAAEARAVAAAVRTCDVPPPPFQPTPEARTAAAAEAAAARAEVAAARAVAALTALAVAPPTPTTC